MADRKAANEAERIKQQKAQQELYKAEQMKLLGAFARLSRNEDWQIVFTYLENTFLNKTLVHKDAEFLTIAQAAQADVIGHIKATIQMAHRQAAGTEG